ncbi:MAG: hypothetical protein ACREUY_09670 [Burkholderiales bacterium]
MFANMAKPKLGSGKRFAQLKAKIAAKGNVRNPAAVAAAIGRKKYGKARFQKLAAAGRVNKGRSPVTVGIASHVQYVS